MSALVATLSAALAVAPPPGLAGWGEVAVSYGPQPAAPAGDRGLAEILVRVMCDARQTAWRTDLARRGWGEAALGYVAGVAEIAAVSGGRFELVEGDMGMASVLVPVFAPEGRGVVDLVAIEIGDGRTWRLATGLGLVLGRPWPALGFDGEPRALRLRREPRDWLEAGGWKGGPFQACCLLRRDDEARREILMHEPPGIVADDREHGEELYRWLRARPKGRALPEITKARKGE